MADEVLDANMIRVYRDPAAPECRQWVAKIGPEGRGIARVGATPNEALNRLASALLSRGWHFDPTWQPRDREPTEAGKPHSAWNCNKCHWITISQFSDGPPKAGCCNCGATDRWTLPTADPNPREKAQHDELTRNYGRLVVDSVDDRERLKAENARLRAELLNHTNARACKAIVAHARRKPEPD